MQLAHAAPLRAPRRLAAIAAAFATVLVSATLLSGPVSAAVARTSPPPTAEITDATDGTGSACTGQPAFKAVIVLGPVGTATTQFTGWADKIAASARDAGMSVCKVYTPYADAATVKNAARGADLFVALMHGNGYPHQTSAGEASGTEPNDGNDATAHGLGLNASSGSSIVKYYGADWVRLNLHLADKGIVILSHMCYSAGNSEDAEKIPTSALAIDHVDNFAQGFLGSSSVGGGHPSAVMALQSQGFDPSDPRGTLIQTLMTSTKTLDQVFMTTYTRNTGSTWKDSYLPDFGAIGSTDFYVTQRSDGSTLRVRDVDPSYDVHLDPDLAYPGHAAPATWDPHAPDTTWLDWFAGRSKNIQNPGGSGIVRFGYVRAIAGDLGLKASAWRNGASVPPPPTPTPEPTPTPDLVKVPDVRGETVKKATSMLKAAGFDIGDQVLVYSDTIADGQVVDTDPSRKDGDVAARYPRGTTLGLKVSRGVQPPAKLSTFKADQGSGTAPAGADALPVFTPNGDGTSDLLTLRYTSSRAAKIKVTVKDGAAKVVRTFSVAGKAGSSTFTWNGKDDAGKVVPDGTYVLAAHVAHGNTRTTKVKSLTAIKVPTTSRIQINASDRDSLARTATQSVAVRTTTTLLWQIVNANGEIVRTGIDGTKVTKGTTRWVWDGKDDAGAYVRDGTYTSLVTATTSRGSYSQGVTIRVMPYRVVGDFLQRPGQRNTFTIYAAEDQKSTPVITVKQPGISSYKLTLKKVGTNRWSAVWKARPGKKGTVAFTVIGTDVKGGKDSGTWKGTIQ